MGKKEFDASLADGIHQRLARMAGDWQGDFRLWVAPGDPAGEAPQRGTIRSILGGRFLLHEYESSFQGGPIAGVAIYGYHLDDGAYESAWVESFGTGKVDDATMIRAINDVFDLRPKAIITDLDLLRPIYAETAAYGHFGRELPNFTWERLDRVDALRRAAGL